METENPLNVSSPLPKQEITSSVNVTTTYVSRCHTTTSGGGDDVEAWIDDATWILTSSFIIFTMQSGKIN